MGVGEILYKYPDFDDDGRFRVRSEKIDSKYYRYVKQSDVKAVYNN